MIEVDPETYEVRADGELLTCEPATCCRWRSATSCSLVEVRARDAASFARLAWHLGNRHLPTQIDAERILIRDDHVIVDMLRGLGAEVRKVRAPFDPEGGAYGQHNHDTGHRHGGLHAERHG
jgi:urease accessory protein